MAQSKYEPLRQNPDTKEFLQYVELHSKSKNQSTVWILTLLLLFVSLTVNVITLTPISSWQRVQVKETGNHFVNLSRNVTKMIAPDSRTVDDEMWQLPRYNYQHGVVALSDEYVREHDLPPAQRYPWDSSKSIYLLHGFHSMHCILVFRQLIIETRDNLSHGYSIEHMTHCMQALREDVECRADDLPRFIGRYGLEKDSEVVHPGHGQYRQCRDWDQLHRFAVENTACYDESHVDMNAPLTEAYKTCPDGSKPWIKDENSERPSR